MDSPAHRLHARAYPYEHVGRYARPNYYAQLEKMRELPKHGSHSCLVHTAATPGIFVAVVFFSLFELKKKKKKHARRGSYRSVILETVNELLQTNLTTRSRGNRIGL